MLSQTVIRIDLLNKIIFYHATYFAMIYYFILLTGCHSHKDCFDLYIYIATDQSSFNQSSELLILEYIYLLFIKGVDHQFIFSSESIE